MRVSFRRPFGASRAGGQPPIGGRFDGGTRGRSACRRRRRWRAGRGAQGRRLALHVRALRRPCRPAGAALLLCQAQRILTILCLVRSRPSRRSGRQRRSVIGVDHVRVAPYRYGLASVKSPLIRFMAAF